MREYYANGRQSPGFWKDDDVEIKVITPREGMTDSEFIYNLIHNVQNYQNNFINNPVEYSLNPAYSSGYNCNSFSNSLLQNSGSNQTEVNDFKGADWGKHNLVPSYHFKTTQDQINQINTFNNIINNRKR